MAVVGDRVEVPSKRVGQLPREGVVTGVSGGLLRVKWSTGEESTITPALGSLMVVGRVKAGEPLAKKAAKGPAKKSAKQSAKQTATPPEKQSAKAKGAGASKTTSKRSGAHKRGR